MAHRKPFLDVAALLDIGLCLAYRLDLLLAAGFHADVPLVGFVLAGS